MSTEIEHLKSAVEQAHACTATWINTTPVAAKASGKLLWDGNVHIFELTGHPSCARCYAWWEHEFGSFAQRTVMICLREGTVTLASEAVTASFTTTP